MNVLITGGAGFIGIHTSRQLIVAGHHVRVLDCLDPQIHGAGADFPAQLPAQVERMRGDVCHLDDCLSALEGVDAVIHLAARTGVGQSMYDIADYVQTNVTGTATLLEAVVKSKVSLQRLVLSSSRAVYGEGQFQCAEHGLFHPDQRARVQLEAGRFMVDCPACGHSAEPVPTREECDAKPLSAYAITKRHQEDLLRWSAEVFDIPHVILRYFNVYGGGQSLKNPYTGVVSIFYSLLKAGRPVSLYEQGLPVRDFVHVTDVARANVLACCDERAIGQTFNIGSGERHTIGQVAQALAAAMGRDAELRVGGEFRVGDIFACFADRQHVRRTLGFEPGVSLEAGMKQFVAWAAGEEAVDRYDQTVRELEHHGLFGRAQLDASAD